MAGTTQMNALRSFALVLLIATVACAHIQTTYAFGPGNDGTTTAVPVGSEIRFVFPAEFDWNIEATDSKALLQKSSAVGSVGDSNVRIWTFDLRKAGTFVVRATGNPSCLKSVPACAAPSLVYRFTIEGQ
jgi:hypothetical protein